MRTPALLLTGVLFNACGAEPAPSLTDGGASPDALAPTHELTLPAEYAASHAVMLYARLDGGVATEVTELSYALGDGYPTRTTLSAESGYVLTPECEQRPGSVIWRSIREVQGRAAALELVEGKLSVDLREEGDVSAIIEGEITGQRCEAPKPVAIALRSPGALALGADRHLSAEPGTVSISVETTLPVQGLRSFEVVGPDALTSVSAALYLRMAAAKGDISERIEDGISYSLFFPEQSNTVEIRIDSAMTGQGKLCASIPRAWIFSSSSTPKQCVARAGEGDSYFNVVADILAPGECRLEVTIPGSEHRWTAAFSTTQ